MRSDHSESPEAPTTVADTRLDTAELRRRIARADRALAEEFWSGADIDELVAERARFIDAFLAEIWQHWFERNDNLALLAVGGYGRGELHPHSDIDLLILAKKPSAVRDDIAAFVRLLWDLKLDIGHKRSNACLPAGSRVQGAGRTATPSGQDRNGHATPSRTRPMRTLRDTSAHEPGPAGRRVRTSKLPRPHVTFGAVHRTRPHHGWSGERLPAPPRTGSAGGWRGRRHSASGNERTAAGPRYGTGSPTGPCSFARPPAA